MLFCSCNSRGFLKRKYTTGHFFDSRASKHDTKSVRSSVHSERTTISTDDNNAVVKIITAEPKIVDEKTASLPANYTDKNQTERKVKKQNQAIDLSVYNPNVKSKALDLKNVRSKSRSSTGFSAFGLSLLSWAFFSIPFFILILLANGASLTAGLGILFILGVALSAYFAFRAVQLGKEAITEDGKFISKVFGFIAVADASFTFLYIITLVILFLFLI